MRRIIVSLVLVAAFAAGAHAQLKQSSSVVSFKAIPGQDRYAPGESFQLLFEVAIEKPWHTQSHTPTLESLIPTGLTVTSGQGITFGRVAYPPPEMETFEFSEEPLSTYKGTVYLGVTGAVPNGLAAGAYGGKATLRTQACDDKSCLPPSDITVEFPILVAEPGANIARLNGAIYAANESLFAPPGAAGGGGMGEIGGYLDKSGLLLTFVFIFLGGLALNLTPCVYPLIPVTVSYFGGQSEKKRGHVIAHAVLYLLGMAAMYSAIGVAAALTGGLLGAALQHWAVILFIAVVLSGLALSMFGVWEIRPPAFLADIGGKSREGFMGAFMMGLTVGIIAAPCIGPFVLGLLTFVGERGDPALGFSMFFVLALGLGLPFMILAIFSGAVSALPQSGMWMVWVRQFFGFVLFGMALYFLQPLIPEAAYLPLYGVFVIASGLYLGWISKAGSPGAAFKMARSVVGAVAVVVGALMVFHSQSAESPGIEWKKATAEAVENAASSNRPVIIDFTADWCLPCKELDHYTFRDEGVVSLSSGFEALRADFTTAGDPDAEAMKKRFNVAGVPTVVFIDASGKEREDLRFVGFIEADSFIARMKSLKQ